MRLSIFSQNNLYKFGPNTTITSKTIILYSTSYQGLSGQSSHLPLSIPWIMRELD